MQERSGEFFEDMEMASNVKRYEAMMSTGIFTYFDVEEIETVVNYYIDNNKLDKAQKACLSGLTTHPTSQELKLKNAQICVGRGLAIEAIKWLDQVKEFSNTNHEYFLTKGMAMILLNHIEKAIDYFNRSLKLSPESEKENVLFNIGDALENSGNHEKAIGFYLMGIEISQDTDDFYFRLGFCYDRKADFEKSIYYYQKYLDYNPFSENVWYNLGIIYNKIEDFEKSIDAYEYAIALDNSHYDAIFNLANALANNDRYAEAIKTYEEYVQFNPINLIAKYYIGECLIQLKKLPEALEKFNEILTENTDFPEAYYGKAMVYDELDDSEKAVENYRIALNLDDENTDAWFSLGNLFSKLNRLDDAIEALDKVVLINKFDIEAWLLNAEINDKIYRLNRSIELLSEATDYLPDSSDILFSLSAYYFKNENSKMGILWFKNAFEIDSENFETTFKIYPKARFVKEIIEITKGTN